MGDFDKALEDANSCICKSEFWAKSYALKCRALIGLERFNEAEEALNQGRVCVLSMSWLRLTLDLFTPLKLDNTVGDSITGGPAARLIQQVPHPHH